ncbi:hypothetical protein K457DRAFT_1838159, partial [Linnemannia elongata AG-77]
MAQPLYSPVCVGRCHRGPDKRPQRWSQRQRQRQRRHQQQHGSNSDIFEQDSLRDQLALLSPQVYTQLEYERARRVKEERHRRKKQRKRDF